MEFKKRSDLHLARKFWHSITVFLMAVVYYYLPNQWSGLVLFAACLIFIPLDFLRKKNEKLNRILLRLFQPIIRQNEVQGIAGTTYLLAGVFVVYLFAPREIMLLTLLYLAFADPIASYVGIKFGKTKIFNGKSLQGSSAAFFVCAAMTFIVLSFQNLFVDHIWLLSVLGGLLGSAAEAIPIGKLDDNFSIPVVSAIGLWILFSLFGGL